MGDNVYGMGRKKLKIFILFHILYKWVLRGFGCVLTTFGFRGRQIRDMTPCIWYGTKKTQNFFFFSFDLKMIPKVFWTCFGDFCFSRSANPLHDSMYKVWARKNEKFIFVSFDLKMIPKVFWMCFDGF